MVDATVSFAIEKLSDFLTQEVNTRLGVKDGVRWLKDELGYLQSAVRQAELDQESNPLIRQWINNIKDVANDAVIILERFSTLQEEEQAAPRKNVLDCLRSSICMCRKEAKLYDIGKEIESLRGRVVEIKNRRDEYGITNILANPIVQQRKRTVLRATSFENQVDVVGFEDDFKTLLDELVGEDPSLKVISIHGMGGLGKTTLASKLYHSSKLNHFHSHAWVCVSQEYNIKDVLRTIIKSIMGHKPGRGLDMLNMNEVDLLQHLRKLLLGRDRYLAVIDDIWDIEAWEKIKKAFPDKKNGSRVIITTRNKIIAQRVDDRCFVHALRFLREDESWDLFCKRAKPLKNLEQLGKEMVGKCGGLPLAIMVLSGLLFHKKSYEDWVKVKDDIWRQLKGESAEIQDILNLSYYDLSLQIRQCFLYLARFPEDFAFKVDNLKLLWLAEEFISEADEEDGVVMEDVAENYLIELINRNMIWIEKWFWGEKVHTCRMHDLVRDLAIQKSKEEKLLGIFDSSKLHTGTIRLLQEQPRHVIYNDFGKYLQLPGPGFTDLKLRSLAITARSSQLRLEDMKLIYSRFKYIKVLDLTYVSSNRIPEEIGELVLLKFFGLIESRYAGPLAIPPTIGKLKKLQTLCSSGVSVYEFPVELCELKGLRHLSFPNNHGIEVTRSMKISGHQTELQTVDSMWFENWIQIDTLNLIHLHTLTILTSSKEGIAYSLDSVANLSNLQTFILEFDIGVIPTIKPLLSCKRLKAVTLHGKISDRSELSYLPLSVTNITLLGSKLMEDPMPTLERLSNLIGLHLDTVYMGKKMVCNNDALPCLKYLILRNFHNLEEWLVEDGALSSLKIFESSGCNKLKKCPVKRVPFGSYIATVWYLQ
ncbi:hypothetical protein ACET3Z_014687 [Daucus carota]